MQNSNSAKSKILVVDDNELNLEIVSLFLSQRNFEIITSKNGKEAIKMTQESSPDLILLDILLPDINGFAVCKEILANESTKEIPVIFLTSQDETSDIVKGFNVGGVDYITKPFKKEELFARVNTHVELKLMRDYLKKLAYENKLARNSMMQVLLNYGKKVNAPD